MKFVSIDVGIKNLSFCLFNKNESDSHFEILKWDNIDLTEKYETTCMEQNKSELCGKPAKFTKDGNCYCLKHSKKMNYLLPKTEFGISYLNKQKLSNLINIADKYNITYEKPCKKNDLINIIIEFSNKNCFESILKINATKVDLVTIGKNIQHKFDLLFQEHLDSIQTIIIENQIGPLANKMKTIQGMLSQYFIMKNNNIKIDFISSSNKLKDFIKKGEKIGKKGKECEGEDKEDEEKEYKDKEDKLDYKQRKQLGVKTCLEIVAYDFKYNVWSSFLQKHKKKDDLSDCFLQGLWYIKNKINKLCI